MTVCFTPFGRLAKGPAPLSAMAGYTTRVFEVDPNTVLGWLVEAPEQLQAFSCCFLCDLHVKQVQLDELYAVLSAVKDGAIRAAKAIIRFWLFRYVITASIHGHFRPVLHESALYSRR